MANAKKRRVGPTPKDTTSLADVVLLVHPQLSPFLSPQDACNLLLSCRQEVCQDVRDAIATSALKYFYLRDSVHFGLDCGGNWNRLMPYRIQGRRGCCACNWSSDKIVIPKELPLPKILDAHVNLLQAMCLLFKGIKPYCYKVLQFYRSPRRLHFGTLQPVVCSLVEAVEKQRVDERPVAPIDPDNEDELSRLLDSMEPGMGTNFFSPSNTEGDPLTVLEAHWRGIQVDKQSNTSTCLYRQRRINPATQKPVLKLA